MVGVGGAPISSALVPAEETSMLTPARSAADRIAASAAGERQVFPVQTTTILMR
jgi:hypothetical protein